MTKRAPKLNCPECGSSNVNVVTGYFTKRGYLRTRVCDNCGCRWQALREKGGEAEVFVKILRVLEGPDKATEEQSNNYWLMHGALIRAKAKKKKLGKNLQVLLTGLRNAGERSGIE